MNCFETNRNLKIYIDEQSSNLIFYYEQASLQNPNSLSFVYKILTPFSMSVYQKTWIHLVITFSDGSLKVYINTILITR